MASDKLKLLQERLRRQGVEKADRRTRGVFEVGCAGDETSIFFGMGQPDFYGAYIEAADALLGVAEAASDSDRRAIPVFFLQRHALELGIKGLLDAVYATPQSSDGENSLVNQKIRKRPRFSHKLTDLMTDLQDVLSKADWESERVLVLRELEKQFTKIDNTENGTWARYNDYDRERNLKLMRRVTLPLREFQSVLCALDKSLFSSADGSLRYDYMMEAAVSDYESET